MPVESLMPFDVPLKSSHSIAVLAAMFFEIDALILAVVIVAFVAHEITTNLDVRIALPARRFTPLEQRLHDYLTALPFAAVCLLLATHLDQIRGIAAADWSLRWKTPPLPTAYLICWNVAAMLFNITPYCEELLRCFWALRQAPAKMGQ